MSGTFYLLFAAAIVFILVLGLATLVGMLLAVNSIKEDADTLVEKSQLKETNTNKIGFKG